MYVYKYICNNPKEYNRVFCKQSSLKMDSIFSLEEAERSSLLQRIIHEFGCTYICLWSYISHPSSYLIFSDGVYNEKSNQASSSSGSPAMRSFLDYQKSIFSFDNYSGGVPGIAFMHNLPCMEFKGLELLRAASNTSQRQFYHEAGIKTAIFMGCKTGEIELGTSNDSSKININIEDELKKLVSGNFPKEVLPQPLDQGRASSSSSSLRSLSMENSSEYSPFLFNMLQTSYNPGMLSLKEAFLDQQQAPNQIPPSSTLMTSEDPLQQAINQIRSMPSREHEEAAITKAILAAISSPPSCSSSQQTPHVSSAFKRYRTYLGPTKQWSPIQSRRNLNRRSLAFFRNLSESQSQQNRMIQTTRPTSNQLHHMIAERKRREKLNDSFQALRSLLPPGSKKDKASVLSNTKEYISSLKSQVEELNKRNKILEAEHSRKESVNQDSSGERLTVEITDVADHLSTSESRVVDLEVNMRGNSILADMVIRVMEFIKQVENVNVMSVDADTRMLETHVSANRVVLRLRIQGEDWDGSTFEEAVRRVLDDLAQ